MRRKLPYHEFVEADVRGIELGFEKMKAILALLPSASSNQELVERAPGLIAAAVSRIESAAAPFDAFDVIESLKMRELPMGFLGFSEREHDGMAAVIEIAAIVLLSRGARAANVDARDDPGDAVEAIDLAARQLLLLGALVSIRPPSSDSAEDIARTEIAESLKSFELTVRNHQYQSIRDHHDSRLFGAEQVVKDMAAELGFDFADFVAVREAIQNVTAERLQHSADQLYGAVGEAAAAGLPADSLSNDLRKRALSGLTGLFLHPGARASFTADEIAARTGIDVAAVLAILTPFTLTFKVEEASVLVRSFLDGENPFSSKSLLVDADGNYLSTGSRLGDDMLRAAVEKQLPDKAKARYVSVRARVSEELASAYLKTMMRPDQQHTSLKYWAPAAGQSSEVVARESTGFKAAAKEAEMDALIIAEDVAICVEVKGAGLRQESRGGHALKLASDLAKTVGEAAVQAERARTLIEVNHGLQTESGWLNLEHVREVHSVVVTLDDLGPAGIALDTMVRANVVRTLKVPWIVSLHDLAVICHVVDRPAEFLLYLRRRTSPTFSQVFHAVDELDLFMMFLQGGLFLEDDPDRVAAANPACPPVTSAERRRYQRSLVPKTVGTHTDPLDQWMYASEHPESPGAYEYPKPHFKSEVRIGAIVDDMTRERRPGWLRAGADLLAFSGDAQSRVARAIERTAASTRADGEWHNAYISQMSERGHFGLFIGSVPSGVTVADATARLKKYALAKIHQMHVDHSLGLIVSPAGEIVSIGYGNHSWEEDPDLDALITAMGLTSADRMPRSMPPPSARRATFRLRGKPKTRKRSR